MVCHSFDFITFKTAENEIAIIFIWAISKAAPSSESHYDDCRPWWLISTSLYSHRKIKHSLCWRFVVFERFPFIISNFVFNHAFSASKHSAVVSLETFGKLLLDPAISEKWSLRRFCTKLYILNIQLWFCIPLMFIARRAKVVCIFIETPMSLAASLSDPRSMMLTLVEAGAHLDFRNAAGQTAIHQAAKLGNDVALQVSVAAELR